MLRAPDSEINLHSLTCPRCGARGRFIRWGRYRRNLVLKTDCEVSETKVYIRRVFCSSCKATHALIPLEVVPRSPFSISFCLELMRLRERGATIESICLGFGIGPTTFYRIEKRYRKTSRLALDESGKGCLAKVKDIYLFVVRFIERTGRKPFEGIGSRPP